MHSTSFVVISGLIAIVLLIILITRLKLHPFFALLISSVLLGIVNDIGVTKSVTAFTHGFGGQLSVTGVVIGLGAMLGGTIGPVRRRGQNSRYHYWFQKTRLDAAECRFGFADYWVAKPV